MNNWLPSPGKLIVALIAVFALGLAGAVAAFFSEIIEWMRVGRQMFEQRNQTTTGALGSGAAIAAVLSFHQITGHRYL